MSPDVTPDVKQARMKEFMQLLPLTMELAGLPKGAPGTLFTPDQMDLRVTYIRNAYKLARQLVRDVGENGV